jgi:hypothetical protein
MGGWTILEAGPRAVLFGKAVLKISPANRRPHTHMQLRSFPRRGHWQDSLKTTAEMGSSPDSGGIWARGRSAEGGS